MNSRTIFFYNDSHIVGGHEILTARIINHLVDALNIPVFLCYSCDEFLTHLSPGVHTAKLPFHGKTKNLYSDGKNHISLIRSYLRTAKPDLAIIAQGYIESGVRGVIACHQHGIPTGSYIPFGNTNRELGNRWAGLRDLISLPVYAMNQFYITISPYQKRMLSRLTGDTPIYLINNPVAYSDIGAVTPRQPPQPSAERPLQLAVIARILFKQKNQDLVVRAAALLQKSGYPVQFHIIGDGPDMPELKALISRVNVSDLFTFHGWLNGDELSACRAACDAVIMPSHYEGLPLVFLESLYAGLPVLTSKLPFLEDFPISTDYQFAPDSAESLAEAVEKLSTLSVVEDVTRLQQHIHHSNSYPRFCEDIETTFQTLLDTLVRS